MSLYGSKLGSMSHVLGVLSEDTKKSLSTLDTENTSVGQVLTALYAAVTAFNEFEYTPEQKKELASLEEKKATLDAVDVDAAVLSEVLKAQKTPAKALEIMQSLDSRKEDHASAIASVQSEIDTLTHAAQDAAETAFAAGMQSKGKSTGDGTRAVWEKIVPVGKRCMCKHGKHVHNILVTGETSYQLYQTVDDNPYAQCTHNSKDNPLPEGFTLKAASSVRRLSDCIQDKKPLTLENLKSYSNGIGKRIDNDSGSLLSTHDDMTTWQKAADTRATNFAEAEKEDTSKK